ncbi:MAG: transporter associated domain-containing protein, partial [Oxalicibacterium faecigallinarum]|uniref:transporter associated domain-containing protein n=1 Tax=Oxalicibacterium faecigallinarum TaxID=573741 RepID=UPI0028071244
GNFRLATRLLQPGAIAEIHQVPDAGLFVRGERDALLRRPKGALEGFPAVDGERDNVVGILMAKDLLRYYAEESFDVRQKLRKAVFIPESKRLNVLLTDFRSKHNHMAIVVDEYGGVAGLITIEDVLEQIVGDIEDEYDFDEEEDNILAIAAGKEGPRWRVKAQTEIAQFNEELGTTLVNPNVETIGGFITDHLARVPHKDEEVEIEHLRFRIVRADARHIHMLLVEKLPVPDEEIAEN